MLGPILFTIFINDLLNNISSFCKIFTDDTKIYDIATNGLNYSERIELLQLSEKLALYFYNDKCKVMHVGKTNPKYNYTTKVDDNDILIKKCTEEKDLGYFRQ